MSRAAIITAGLLLLAAIAFLVLPDSRTGDSGETGDQSEASARLPAGSADPGKPPRSVGGPPPREPRRKSTEVTSHLEPSPNFPLASEHTPEQLRDFILPELRLEDTSLEEAVQTLLQHYADICARTNETPLPFSLSLADGLGQRVTLDLRNRSFLSALRQIAAQAGVTVNLAGTELRFSPADGPGAQATILGGTGKSVPKKIKYKTEVITAQSALDIPLDRALAAAEIEAFKREALAVPGTGARTVPQVVFRPGQDAEIAMAGNGNTDLAIRVAAQRFGFGLHTIAEISGAPPSPETQHEGDSSHDDPILDDIVPNGHSFIRHLEGPDGSHQYFLLTPTLIDLTH